ncbi:protocadherin-like wing polarity protein stan, partial [Liolophura sinensis]|uniref:protocadherin-like wing polarity protein stan n=1 Tax=Liolophura sinensis TaxID=3198878 RepID=UPI0031580E2F
MIFGIDVQDDALLLAQGTSCALVFTKQLYEVNCEENTYIGTIILTVNASDADTGPPGDLVFSIDPPNPWFTTDNEGNVKVNAKLDAEDPRLPRVVRFVVSATDQAQPSLTAKADVVINIIDVNDHRPKWSKTLYSATLTDGDPPNKSVIHTNATDGDRDATLVFKFHLAESFLAINRSTGEITTTKTIVMSDVLADKGSPNFVVNLRADDGLYVEGAPVLIIVYAKDPTNTAMNDSLVVNVILTPPGFTGNNVPGVSGLVDCSQAPLPNNYDPSFSENVYDIKVYENVSINTVIKTLSASDPDRGQSGIVTYNLNSPYLTIEPSGNISIIKDVDFENPSERRICADVTATDLGTPPRSATTTVCLNVMNINDNRPEFGATGYTASVKEGDPPGTSVANITASDKDDDTLRFSLLGQQDYFSINPTTGEITVAKAIDVADLLQGSTGDIVSLMVRVTDGIFTNDVTVTVKVEDKNRYPPVFDVPVYNVTVEENRSGVGLVTVRATDNREVPHQQVTYLLGNVPSLGLISINPTSGTVTLVAPLDREGPLGDRLSLLLYAVDDGNPGPVMTGTATLSITVTDVNDNPPRYDTDSYNLLLPQTYTSGQRYATSTATDLDIGENARIEYELISSASGAFRLDKDTSEITTVADWWRRLCKDRQLLLAKGQFIHNHFRCILRHHKGLRVRAFNPNMPSRNEVLDINMALLRPGDDGSSIQDVLRLADCSTASSPNVHPPKFSRQTYEVNITENMPVNYVLLVTSASDADSGLSGKVVYTVNSPYFNIGPSGNISTSTVLDFENPSERRICFEVMATDLGVPPMSATAAVCVTVTNLN